MSHFSKSWYKATFTFNVWIGLWTALTLPGSEKDFFSTANPTWGDIFESSKLNLLPRFSEKRRSSFELWALKQHSKCHPKWDWLYFQKSDDFPGTWYKCDDFVSLTTDNGPGKYTRLITQLFHEWYDYSLYQVVENFQCGTVHHCLVPGKCFERHCHRSKLNSWYWQNVYIPVITARFLGHRQGFWVLNEFCNRNTLKTNRNRRQNRFHSEIWITCLDPGFG